MDVCSDVLIVVVTLAACDAIAQATSPSKQRALRTPQCSMDWLLQTVRRGILAFRLGRHPSGNQRLVRVVLVQRRQWHGHRLLHMVVASQGRLQCLMGHVRLLKLLPQLRHKFGLKQILKLLLRLLLGLQLNLFPMLLIRVLLRLLLRLPLRHLLVQLMRLLLRLTLRRFLILLLRLLFKILMKLGWLLLMRRRRWLQM